MPNDDSRNLKTETAWMLYAVWGGIPTDYKVKYARNIWDQFQGAILTAAYTDNLAKFVNRLCSRFGAVIPEKFRARALALLNSGEDQEVLRRLREETVLLVMMVRALNEERKENL